MNTGITEPMMHVTSSREVPLLGKQTTFDVLRTHAEAPSRRQKSLPFFGRKGHVVFVCLFVCLFMFVYVCLFVSVVVCLFVCVGVFL